VRAALLGAIALLAALALTTDVAPAPPVPVRAVVAGPTPPFPYTAEDVLVRSGDQALAGTLTLPPGPGPFAAVVLISGSGAQDRDYTVDGQRPFLVLADALTRAGFAVLRTDDRGVGSSAGSYAHSSYDDLTSDVLAEVAYLADRPEVDPARIGLLGHSEGAYLAPLAVTRSQDMVAFVVLLSAPAESGADLLGERARSIDRQRIGPRFRSFLDHDPAPALSTLATLSMPVLAVAGDHDTQVPAQRAVPELTRLLAGDPNAAVRELPGLDHLLEPADTAAISPAALDLVTSWMKEHTS
jgi:alpha-beta hydrolase superfamily lysophospholipase